MSEHLKVYKLSVMVIDDDGLGGPEIKDVLENTRYANRCINPKVVVEDVRDIVWDDAMPINRRVGWEEGFKTLFREQQDYKTCGHVWQEKVPHPTSFQTPGSEAEWVYRNDYRVCAKCASRKYTLTLKSQYMSYALFLMHQDRKLNENERVFIAKHKDGWMPEFRERAFTELM